MELRLSNLAKTYPASGIRKMFDLAAGYDDVIALTLGEPNFETPAYIKEAAKKALDENYTHYAPNAGLPVLREAIAKRYQKSHWTGYKAENVIVTVGALEGLTLGMLALLNPGDEILVPDPGFANYYGQAKIVGAVPVPVPAHEENGFNMTAADIEKCITPKTKAIIVNSPCNPTGAVMSEADVRAIAEVVKKHNLWVFSDEPYDAIVYDGVKAFSMAEIDEVRDHVVILNSFSKTYAMTGWRIGFLLMSDPNYIKEMAKLNEGLVSCVSSFSQVAAAEALSSNECVKSMVADYTRRRDILVDGINAVPGFTCAKPKGSFYAFVNIKAFGKSSQEFAEELIRGAHVICVPGTAFGAMGEGYLRLVFANSDENLKEAVRRIDEYVRKAYPDMK